MAVITRIELVNYLSEGWQPSMGAARWRPLWPANTLLLAGLSTAIQVPNGCGKTSATNAILFLLSRDRELKKEFLSRCAPVEAGYSHVRIEFAMRDEDLFQRNLISCSANDYSAKTYVIGVCANRGDEDLQFYRHAGTLETTPAYRTEGTTIAFTPNEEFRRTVAKNDWHRGTVADWSKVVSEFMSHEVVRQNVLFHRSGAGDASATFKKVVVEPGERFDEAYFRVVAAPQLLANLMGEAAEEDERAIEDTITISMTRFIDAKLKVERKQIYLQRREAMEAEFVPVLSAATAIREAQTAYQHQLQALACDAAFFDWFAGRSDTSLPGVPRDLDKLQVGAGVKQCLAGMALDKDGSIVIADGVLAQLLEKNTGNLNLIAGRSSINRESISAHPASSQLIDFNCNIKIFEGSGGRRKEVRFYDLAGVRELVTRCITDGQSDYKATLEQAFNTAEQALDTNHFRKEQRRLTTRMAALKNEIEVAVDAGKVAETQKAALESQVTQRAENHAAYQEFCAQANLLPEPLRSSPLEARTWLDSETDIRQANLKEHFLKVGKLTAGWQALLQWRHTLGIQTPADRRAELVQQKEKLTNNIAQAQAAHEQLQTKYTQLSAQQSQLKAQLEGLERQQVTLSPLLDQDLTFRRLFGDVDPLTVSPPTEERGRLQTITWQKAKGLETKQVHHNKLTALATEFQRFKVLFGDLDPLDVHPNADWDSLVKAQHTEEKRLLAHEPLADAFAQHMQDQGVEPTEWLRQTEATRLTAERQRHEAAQQIEQLQHEIKSLEDLSLVQETHFEHALTSLTNAGITFCRLRDVILETEPDKTRCLALLAAFSSLLDAPVVSDIVVADRAMGELDAINCDVPIVLREPLLDALRSPDLAITARGAAVSFLAGTITRRIQAIIDPDALEEVKTGLEQQLKQLVKTHDDAAVLAKTCDPHSDTYQQALRAQIAVREHSVIEAADADQQLKILEPKLIRAKQLITDAALRTLSQAIEYIQHGADTARDTVACEIEDLKAEIETLEVRIGELEPVTSNEAVIAHDGAVKLARAGGMKQYRELETSIHQLAGTHQQGVAELMNLGADRQVAHDRCDDTAQRWQHFQDEFEPQLRTLQETIEFELAGYASFMEAKDDTQQALEADCGALKPLARVNFDRAQNYKDHENEDDALLQKQIAEAIQAHAAAVTKAHKLQRELGKMDGLQRAANRGAEALHELAHFLIEKRNAVAPYFGDLALREGGSTPAEAHPLYPRSEELRHLLADWRHEQGPFDITRLTAIRSEVEEIDVTQSGGAVREAKKRAERARAEFQALRTAFCTKAAASDAAALSQAEIEAIQAANSLEQLQELARLGERLHADLAQEHADLTELQESASTVEAESIATLSRLVESCRTNLKTMNDVMGRNPNARFFIDAKIISDEDIVKLMVKLRDGIEARKRSADSKSILGRRDNDNSSIRTDVRRALIDGIFTGPSVQFHHIGMWDGKTQPIQDSLSEGQKAALQMMWLIKESEYHLECAVRRHLGGGAKKKLRNRSQRILFFDGLFSNLTDRGLIDEAFKGLGEASSNLQLIGLIHNPEYRNNPSIFPSLIVGRRAGWRTVDGERSFIRFEDGRANGALGLATFISKQPTSPNNGQSHE